METRSPSALEDHLGYWLRLVSNHVSGTFATRLAEQDLAVADWVVLRILQDGDATPSHVASRLQMTRGAVTKIVDRLLARHLMSRRAADEDGRSQWLALTTRGRALVPVLAALADANDAEFFGTLCAPERKVLMMLLQKIARGRTLQGIPVQ